MSMLDDLIRRAARKAQVMVWTRQIERWLAGVAVLPDAPPEAVYPAALGIPGYGPTEEMPWEDYLIVTGLSDPFAPPPGDDPPTPDSGSAPVVATSVALVEELVDALDNPLILAVPIVGVGLYLVLK